MCGPADFAALDLCVVRLTALSTVGLATYSVYRTAALHRRLLSELKGKTQKAGLKSPEASLVEARHGCADA